MLSCASTVSQSRECCRGCLRGLLRGGGPGPAGHTEVERLTDDRRACSSDQCDQ